MFKIILPSLNLKIEKWKWNKEYRVYVSTLGRFKDEHKRNLPIRMTNTGYCQIMTSCGYKLAHRLVMLTFSPIPNAEELTVDHLNHNKRCNEWKNLEWVTYEENQRRAVEDLLTNGTSKKKEKAKIFAQTEFNDINAAVDWVIHIQKITDKKAKGTIKNNIEKAIKFGNIYCGKKWYRENEIIKNHNEREEN